jgi:large subunit ribosomal protein L10
MDVGLSLQVAFYDGVFYEPSVLAIDETEYFNNIVTATQQAFNLSVNAVYPTAATVETIIAKAAGEARNLGVEAVVYESGVVEMIIGRANAQANALKGVVE